MSLIGNFEQNRPVMQFCAYFPGSNSTEFSEDLFLFRFM